MSDVPTPFNPSGPIGFNGAVQTKFRYTVPDGKALIITRLDYASQTQSAPYIASATKPGGVWLWDGLLLFWMLNGQRKSDLGTFATLPGECLLIFPSLGLVELQVAIKNKVLPPSNSDLTFSVNGWLAEPAAAERLKPMQSKFFQSAP